MATADSVQALIDQRQQELWVLLQTHLGGINEFVQDFWDDAEWSDDEWWPNKNGPTINNPGTLIEPQTFIDKLDAIVLPTLPDRPSIPSNIAFNTRQLIDPKFDTLEQHIIDALASGGRAISTEFQNAIFNTDRERKLQALDDTLQRINANFGGRGFRAPSSILQAARNEVIQKYQFDMEQQSREIVKLIEEHLRVNWQFCIQQGIAVENIHTEFIWRYAAMFVANIDAIVRAYVADIEAYTATLKAELDRIMGEIEIVKADASIEDQYYKNLLSKYATQIDHAYKNASVLVQDRSNQANAQLNGMTTMSNAYKDIHNSFTQSNINVGKQSTSGTT